MRPRLARREPHMSPAFARLVVRHVTERGIEPSRLLSARAAALLDSSDPLLRIPRELYLELLDRACALSGDEAFGLRAGQTAHAGHFGLLGMLQQTSKNPRALGPILPRLCRLFHDECALVGEARGDLVYFSYRSSEDGHRQASELAISAWIATARSSWRGYPLVEVQFAHGAPPSLAEHSAIFRVPVRFGAPFHGYLFRARHLDEAPPHSDPALHERLLEYADSLLEATGFVGSVQHTVARGFLLGKAGAPWVASELGLSSRTLHRRLKADGTSFFALVEAERRVRAERYLTDAKARTGEIAQRLGFATTAAFRKAFKRWTGLTPAEFRARPAFETAQGRSATMGDQD